MPEPNVLFAVTAVVVAGLVAWVGYALKTAKEPWARPQPAAKEALAEAPKDDEGSDLEEKHESTKEAVADPPKDASDEKADEKAEKKA